MTYLPMELINKIMSFVERHKCVKIMKYVINDCYKEDYDRYTAEDYYDNYCFQYTFSEWYFLYRKKEKINSKYKHTPKIILVG